MDLHLNAWGVKTRLDGTENVAIQIREIDSKDKVIAHMSKATALALLEDLKKLLLTQASEPPKTGQEK